jgi:hypothetical protein
MAVVLVTRLRSRRGTTRPDDTERKPKEYERGMCSLLHRDARKEKLSTRLKPSAGETVNKPGKGKLLGVISMEAYTFVPIDTAPSILWSLPSGKKDSCTV